MGDACGGATAEAPHQEGTLGRGGPGVVTGDADAEVAVRHDEGQGAAWRGAGQVGHRIGGGIGAIEVVAALQAGGGRIQGHQPQIAARTQCACRLGGHVAAQAEAHQRQRSAGVCQGLQRFTGPAGHSVDPPGGVVRGQAGGVGIHGLLAPVEKQHLTADAGLLGRQAAQGRREAARARRWCRHAAAQPAMDQHQRLEAVVDGGALTGRHEPPQPRRAAAGRDQLPADGLARGRCGLRSRSPLGRPLWQASGDVAQGRRSGMPAGDRIQHVAVGRGRGRAGAALVLPDARGQQRLLHQQVRILAAPPAGRPGRRLIEAEDPGGHGVDRTRCSG